MNRAWWLVPASFVALLSGCGAPGKATSVNSVPKFKELKQTVLKEGKGTLVLEKGDQAFMQYRGTLLDGSEFDSNIGGSGPPFGFIVGRGSVIKGWDEGSIGMKVGETRKLEIPYEKAYGPAGDGGKIPPTADLTFEMTLVYMIKKGDDTTYDVEDPKPGSGPEAKVGDLVEIHYVAKYTNGIMFDDSRKRGETLKFKIGAITGDKVIRGVDDGVRGMKVGGQRKLVLPPSLIFGTIGNQTIKGDQPVEMTIDLVSLNGKKG